MASKSASEAMLKQETPEANSQQEVVKTPGIPWGTMIGNVSRTQSKQRSDSGQGIVIQPKSPISESDKLHEKEHIQPTQRDVLQNIQPKSQGANPIQRLEIPKDGSITQFRRCSASQQQTDIPSENNLVSNTQRQHLIAKDRKQGEVDRDKTNKTGLPNQLKAGIENLSGIPIDDVKVHYNSAKPAQLKALAYAKGTDIYLGPGQERHLPHEAWHVVQQKQGRVKQTTVFKGESVNDDRQLEHEADVMGEKAMSYGGRKKLARDVSKNTVKSAGVSLARVQMNGEPVITHEVEAVRKGTHVNDMWVVPITVKVTNFDAGSMQVLREVRAKKYETVKGVTKWKKTEGNLSNKYKDNPPWAASSLEGSFYGNFLLDEPQMGSWQDDGPVKGKRTPYDSDAKTVTLKDEPGVVPAAGSLAYEYGRKPPGRLIADFRITVKDRKANNKELARHTFHVDGRKD